MEPNERPVETNISETAIRYLQEIGNGLMKADSYALVGAIVLTCIWLMGRVMEAMHGNLVFEPILTRWLGIAIFSLLCIWVIGSGIASVRNLMKAEKRRLAIASWVFFLIIVLSILFNLEGFRISSSGLFATLSGSVESTRQASFLLFKFHPANPMLAVNIFASKMNGVLDIESLMPYVWNSNYVFAFFIWSFAYGILLLLHKGEIWPKTMHLFFCACGLGVLILLKSTSSVTNGQMVLLHVAAVTLFTFQVFLTYAIFRAFAGRSDETPTEPDSFDMPPEAKEPEKEKKPMGLPPSGVKFALCLFLILPILADLQHQFYLAPASARVMKDIVNNHTQADSDLITATRISVYAGPAVGDDVVGVLPKGARVPVTDKKYEWVCIGKNRWVPEKFLRPATVNPRQS